MSYTRSWIGHESEGGTASQGATCRSVRGGAKGLDRSRYGAEPAEDNGRRRTKIPFNNVVHDPAVVPYPRVNVGDTARLARRIVDDGLKTPLLVWMYAGEPYLVDGGRRYLALERIRETNLDHFQRNYVEVEVELVEGTLQQALLAQARANLTARSWDDVDFACACAALVDAGLTKVEIAHKLEETVDRVFDAIEFMENAGEGLVEAVADGYSYDKALDLATKPRELQALVVDSFRQGRPKRKPRTAKKKSVQPGPQRLKPKRRTNTQIGADLDQVEEEIERLVNDDLVPFLTLNSLLRKVDSDLRYRIELTLQIAELRGIRHAKLHTLGRRPDLLLIEDPVRRYERGKRGRAFKIPSWRTE